MNSDKCVPIQPPTHQQIWNAIRKYARTDKSKSDFTYVDWAAHEIATGFVPVHHANFFEVWKSIWNKLERSSLFEKTISLGVNKIKTKAGAKL